MSFDWVEYMRLAKQLAGVSTTPPGQEANHRTAISRAYYAAFCQARNYLRDKDQDNAITSITDAQIHGYVIHQFSDSRDRQRKRIGQNLDRLRRERNRADYEDIYPLQQNWSVTVNYALAYADFVLSELEIL